jgi:hypothetical protein
VLLSGGCFTSGKVQIVRILIANTPLMYRETLALAILRHNPDFEVMIVDPAFLNGEAERFAPDALVKTPMGSRYRRLMASCVGSASSTTTSRRASASTGGSRRFTK